MVHPSRLRVLVKSSVYMRNGWLSCAVMPMMCVLSGCFGNRACSREMAGFEVAAACVERVLLYMGNGWFSSSLRAL